MNNDLESRKKAAEVILKTMRQCLDVFGFELIVGDDCFGVFLSDRKEQLDCTINGNFEEFNWKEISRD